MTDDPWLQFMQSLSAPQGHALRDIQAFDHDQLEFTHTYIQWLFPLPEASTINPEAPVLTALHCEAVAISPLLKKQIGINLDLMLGHWGIQRQAVDFLKAANFDTQSVLWLTEFDHNHLRITRVLAFLAMTGFGVVAERLYTFLHARLQDELYNRIGALKYWRDAIRRSPPAV
ncbi:opioid growth factor receptor-related protein [Pseudomonas taiwanensis]|uniref:opioid growth factor receptor-related protein n=1 Tax=Pseudomonas taiwanensis TaxID=470150 RepID=UPI0028DE6594|nr:opioid growth factor receptor-related protein [Pseudomonas taiwanensis]MDT8924711.1 opioid growth factor receptor-related protein [Pseudomonas taiwanensis]